MFIASNPDDSIFPQDQQNGQVVTAEASGADQETQPPEGGMILPKLKIEKPERFTLKIGYEDAGNNDFNDFIVEIKAQCSIKLQIENCNTSNCKID